MINSERMTNGMGIGTPQCTGLIVIGAIVLLAVLRYAFEGTN